MRWIASLENASLRGSPEGATGRNTGVDGLGHNLGDCLCRHRRKGLFVIGPCTTARYPRRTCSRSTGNEVEEDAARMADGRLVCFQQIYPATKDQMTGWSLLRLDGSCVILIGSRQTYCILAF